MRLFELTRQPGNILFFLDIDQNFVDMLPPNYEVLGESADLETDRDNASTDFSAPPPVKNGGGNKWNHRAISRDSWQALFEKILEYNQNEDGYRINLVILTNATYNPDFFLLQDFDVFFKNPDPNDTRPLSDLLFSKEKDWFINRDPQEKLFKNRKADAKYFDTLKAWYVNERFDDFVKMFNIQNRSDIFIVDDKRVTCDAFKEHGFGAICNPTSPATRGSEDLHRLSNIFPEIDNMLFGPKNLDAEQAFNEQYSSLITNLQRLFKHCDSLGVEVLSSFKLAMRNNEISQHNKHFKYYQLLKINYQAYAQAEGDAAKWNILCNFVSKKAYPHSSVLYQSKLKPEHDIICYLESCLEDFLRTLDHMDCKIMEYLDDVRNDTEINYREEYYFKKLFLNTERLQRFYYVAYANERTEIVAELMMKACTEVYQNIDQDDDDFKQLLQQIKEPGNYEDDYSLLELMRYLSRLFNPKCSSQNLYQFLSEWIDEDEVRSDVYINLKEMLDGLGSYEDNSLSFS